MAKSRKIYPKEKAVTLEANEEIIPQSHNNIFPSKISSEAPAFLAQSPRSNFQFVTDRVPGLKDGNPESRTLIRRYAMHAFLREKNSTHSHIKATRQKTVEVTLEGSVGKFRLGSLPARERKKGISKPKNHAKIVPAGSENKPGSSQLIPLDSSGMNSEVKDSRSLDGGRYQECGLDDQDMGMESIYPETNIDLEPLLTASENMVVFRDRLDQISRPLAKALAFTDLRQSLYITSAPKLSPIVSRTHFPELEIPSSAKKHSILWRSLVPLDLLLGSDFLQTLQDLHKISHFTERYNISSIQISVKESTFLNDWSISIEHCLHSFQFVNRTSPASGTLPSPFFEALRCAAILWLNTAVCHFPISSSMIVSMTKHAIQVLRESEPYLDFWRDSMPDFLLWIMTIVACCTEDRGDGWIFMVQQLQFVTFMEGFIYQADLEQALRRVIFIDGVYLESLQGLWKEIDCAVFTKLNLDFDIDIDSM
ncbi:hypothetical protein B7463_g11116, partial [Scytalidium lignicola]